MSRQSSWHGWARVPRDQVMRMFVGGRLGLAALGLVLGLPLSLLALRAVSSQIGATEAEQALRRSRCSL